MEICSSKYIDFKKKSWNPLVLFRVQGMKRGFDRDKHEVQLALETTAFPRGSNIQQCRHAPNW